MELNPDLKQLTVSLQKSHSNNAPIYQKTASGRSISTL
jgi:hypothetical protein